MTRLCIALALAAAAASAQAQQYPDRPIRVVVSVPAGGTPDVMARMVTTGMSRILGQPLVVDNRGGAGGLIGTEIAAKSAPDGYTLFVSSPGSLTILPHIQKINYDPTRDFVPIGVIGTTPFLLIANPGVPAKSVKELVVLAKSQPGRLNYASAGSGTPNHLAMELFKSMAGVNITHVPYKGAPQAVSDVLAGHMNLMFNSIPPVLAHIRADRIRALGTGGSKRATQLPEVPTISESGVPGYHAESWFGMLAPANMPKPILARVQQAFTKAITSPETRAALENQGSEPGSGKAEDFGAILKRDYATNGKLVKAIGVKID